jgi:hypothetical protein
LGYAPLHMARRVLLGLALVLGVALLGGALLLRHGRPAGVAGPAADELARALERSVDRAAWDRTLAVRFSLGGRYQHLWDRRRGLARVHRDDTEVLLDLGKRDGRAFRGGRELQGQERERLVARAYAAWVNDTFWLNPLGKLFDDGVERLLVEEGGGQALLVQYRSGGLTPGDAYLWLPGEGGRPRAWRLWVSVIPIGGVEASWEGWTRLPTGAWIATRHRMAGVIPLEITGLSGAATLAELEPGPDPFAALSP